MTPEDGGVAGEDGASPGAPRRPDKAAGDRSVRWHGGGSCPPSPSLPPASWRKSCPRRSWRRGPSPPTPARAAAIPNCSPRAGAAILHGRACRPPGGATALAGARGELLLQLQRGAAARPRAALHRQKPPSPLTSTSENLHHPRPGDTIIISFLGIKSKSKILPEVPTQSWHPSPSVPPFSGRSSYPRRS